MHNQNQITNITGDYSAFLDRIFENLKKVGIDVANYFLDHVAMRTTTMDDYNEIKKQLLGISELVGENIIRNRPIGIFKLNTPVKYQSRKIPLFELMAPADGDNYKNILEHVEFVVNENLNNFMAKYPLINFKIDALDRKINPELVLKFPNNANVKFHTRPIDEVLKLQKGTGIL